MKTTTTLLTALVGTTSAMTMERAKFPNVPYPVEGLHPNVPAGKPGTSGDRNGLPVDSIWFKPDAPAVINVGDWRRSTTTAAADDEPVAPASPSATYTIRGRTFSVGPHGHVEKRDAAEGRDVDISRLIDRPLPRYVDMTPDVPSDDDHAEFPGDRNLPDGYMPPRVTARLPPACPGGAPQPDGYVLPDGCFSLPCEQTGVRTKHPDGINPPDCYMPPLPRVAAGSHPESQRAAAEKPTETRPPVVGRWHGPYSIEPVDEEPPTDADKPPVSSGGPHSVEDVGALPTPEPEH